MDKLALEKIVENHFYKNISTEKIAQVADILSASWPIETPATPIGLYIQARQYWDILTAYINSYSNVSLRETIQITDLLIIILIVIRKKLNEQERPDKKDSSEGSD